MVKKIIGLKIVAQNKKALHKYQISDRFEAGLVLNGGEIKSIRAGKVSLSDAYARLLKNELWLINMYIAPYKYDTSSEPDARRSRKLLVKRQELDHLVGKIQHGLTLVPVKLYLKRGIAKVELGLGKGRKLFDKRQVIKERDLKREERRELKGY